MWKADPALRAALRETQAVLRLASQAYQAHSCPASGGCCQLAKTQRPPWVWPSEVALLRSALAEQGRPVPPPRQDGGCPLLDESGRRCSVYAARPFGCRTYFCERRQGPARQPTAATDALLKRLEWVNIALDEGARPRPLPEALDLVR